VTDLELLKELISKGEHADDGYFHYAHLAACLLPKHLHESLRQLVNGPVYDGDVISKSMRGELFRLGLAIRVCVKGEQGYTGATYFAFSLLKCFEDIKAGRIAA
jgi:hypothetical protein